MEIHALSRANPLRHQLAGRPAAKEESAGPTDTVGSAPQEEIPGYRFQAGLTATGEVAPPPGISVDILAPITREAMESRGLTMGYSAEAMAEVKAIGGPAPITGQGVRDLRHLKWASIDNATTRDIDQLAFAEDLGNGRKRLLVAIADVAEVMGKDGALDQQAQKNTSTVYAPGNVQPMIPKELSTDWTSLNPGEDRRAVVTELIIGSDGKVEKSDVFEAAVHNHAKLDYVSVSDWHDGKTEAPGPLAGNPEMQEQARLQLEVGHLLGEAAADRGALAFETTRTRTVIEDDRIVDLADEKKNVANEAVAHMMIATNVANAKFLQEKGFPVFQRSVPDPGRWDRMREVAGKAATRLPAGHSIPPNLVPLPREASSKALSSFLGAYKENDPEGYPELSLSMLKLMGGSDYTVTPAGQPLSGHFGQGVSGGDQGYLHSTAPNRRYPDVITQRLLKAAMAGEPCPYSVDELQQLADLCNEKESATKGAARQVTKAAVSHYLTTQVGKEYDAMVTGSKKKGTFVKVLSPPIEGKLVVGGDEVDVGDKVRVRLDEVHMKKGYIDFSRVSEPENDQAWLTPF